MVIAQRSQNQSGAPRRTGTGKATNLLMRALPYALPVILFSTAVNLLRLTVPLYMLQVIDRVLSSESMETLVSISILAAAAIATSALLSNSSAQIQAQIGTWIDESLFGNVVRGTLDSNVQMDNRRAGAPVRELGQLRQFFASPTASTLLEVPWSFVFAAILFYLHPLLGIVACIATVVLLVVGIIGDRMTQSRLLEGQQLKESSVQILETAVGSSESVKAMGMQERITRKLNAQNLDASAKLHRAARETTLVQNFTRFLRTLAQISMLGSGAFLVLQDETTMGTMIAASILLGLILSPVDKAVGALKALTNATRSVGRLNNQLAMASGPEDTASLAFDEGVKIELRDAMFMPPGTRKPVIRPMTLEIAVGDCIGIVGPLGSGKTTLGRMLIGAITPTNGSVRANEIEIARLLSEDFGRHVGYLGQGELPLSGSIMDNITRFETNDGIETEAASLAAVKMAGVSETVLGLPKRFQTQIGGSGVDALSRGQLQQILIARTFYKDPSYIVMDEPSSYLDKAAELALINSIEVAKKRRATIVMVTQRPNLLAKCNRLLYVKDGSLVVVGDRDQVLKEISRGDSKPGPRRLNEQNQRQGDRKKRLS